MLPYLQINLRCVKCDNCRLICPENAVIYAREQYEINRWACTLCNICVEVCPTNAITKKTDRISQEQATSE